MRRITGSMLLFWGAAFIGRASMGQPNVHPVISEFRFFEHKDVNEEFVELYNPTGSTIPLKGWKIVYKKKTGGEWRVKAAFTAGHRIAPHGFFLWGGDKTAVPPDVVETSRYSINFSSSAGHVALWDSSGRVVDLAAWGGGDSAEGISVSGPFVEGGSVERKANGLSTFSSMSGSGADASAGNGFDSDSNRSDFVLHNHFTETNPQNTSSPAEPEWTAPVVGGACGVSPKTVSVLDTVSLRFLIRPECTVGLHSLLIRIPEGWGWSFRPGDVGLEGACFTNAEASVSGDTVHVSGMDLSDPDSGAVILRFLAVPAESDSSEFPVFTSPYDGGWIPVRRFPAVFAGPRALPIIRLHQNDAEGVPLAPFGAGCRVMISGIVTAGRGTFASNRVFVQDATAGIALDGASGTGLPATGDSITVEGAIGQARGMTAIFPDWPTLTVHCHDRPLPEPVDMTCSSAGRAFLAGGSEPDEGRLIRIRGATVDSESGMLTDDSSAVKIFIECVEAVSIPAGAFDVTGILVQCKDGADEPPYTSGYQIAPRNQSDLVLRGGPGSSGSPEGEQSGKPPAGPDLFRNYPNPFNQETVIRYRVNAPGAVQITVHDLRGREIARLAGGMQAAGEHSVAWKGTDDAGRPVPGGVYFIRFCAGGAKRVLKALLLK
jgi:hypothetical protein